jgi:hypothetical protein
MSIGVVNFVVRGSDDVIDTAASLQAFHDHLTCLVEQEADDRKVIGEAVDKVFEENGARLPKKFLVTKTLGVLKVPFEEWASWEKKIAKHLKSGAFSATTGAGGGISRV